MWLEHGNRVQRGGGRSPQKRPGLRSTEDLGKHWELLPRLPLGLPVPCPEAAGECPGRWRSRPGRPLTFSGSCSPCSGCVCLHLNVLRVRPQSTEPNPTRWCTWYSLHLVFTPHQLRPREAPWWVGGSVEQQVCLPAPVLASSTGRQGWRGWGESSVQEQG